MNVQRYSVTLLLMSFLVPFFAPLDAYAQVPNVGGTGGCPVITRTLSFGMRGTDVVQLQNFLIARGNLTAGNNTGYFGGLTQAAVQSFQKAQGISPIGIVGPQTRAAIARVCGGGGPTSPASNVSMSLAPTSGTAPLAVTFSLAASVNYCDSYVLDFGDGSSEALSTFCGAKTVKHTYATQGNYLAHLDRYVQSNGQVVRSLVAQTGVSVGAKVLIAPTCTMTLSKNTIVPSESVTLSWSSTNATSGTWADGSSAGASGSSTLTGLSATTVKTITFTGEGGTKACSVTLTVTPPPTGTITASGNATANGSVATLPSGGQSAYKIAEFTLTAGAQESVTMTSFKFTLRNQTAASAPGAATVSNYRVTIGTASYPVSVSKSGIYDTGTVSVSGVVFAPKQSLGVAIFADIIPASGGNLDLWIYPDDMTFSGNTSGVVIKPTSNVTNRVDSALLYWSGWISVQLAQSSSNNNGPTGDCILNGVGQSAVSIDACLPTNVSGDGAGGRGGGEQPNQCKQLEQGQMICTNHGFTGGLWGGGYINPQGVTVACTSSNTFASPYGAAGPIWVPGGMKVLGLTCTEQDTTSTYCSGYYICKRDGWWKLDGAGFESKKVDGPLQVLPESFYP